MRFLLLSIVITFSQASDLMANSKEESILLECYISAWNYSFYRAVNEYDDNADFGVIQRGGVFGIGQIAANQCDAKLSPTVKDRQEAIKLFNQFLRPVDDMFWSKCGSEVCRKIRNYL